MPLLLLLLACSPAHDRDTGSPGTDTDTDTSTDTSSDTDTDTDTDSDTDTDTDTDTDADADTDADTDTGTSPCTTADLVFTAEVRDESGVCTTCAASSVLTFAGVISNPCTADVLWRTPDPCITYEWSLTDIATGMGTAYDGGCMGAPTDHLVPAGGFIDDPMSWGRVDPGRWSMSVVFNDGIYTSAHTRFVVE